MNRTHPAPPGVAPRPQLMTYPDSLGGGLADLGALLAGPVAGHFHGVHILPPFPSSGDRGFAPTTYREIDPAHGSWTDIERIARTHDVLLDVMINHISRRSEEFVDFERNGRRSRFADLFITLDKVWPGAEPDDDELARIALRKPGSPFSTIALGDGTTERIWTTFGDPDWSEQIDLDVRSPATRSLIREWLGLFASHGVRLVRLDAVGYVTKRARTSCFMVEPEIHEFLDWITGVAAEHGQVLLPEVHDAHTTRERLTARGFWSYDFVLPGLLLEALHSRRAGRLAAHLAASPATQFTMLDCHDGIPVRPDLDGILTDDEMHELADRTVDRGGNVSRLLAGVEPGRPDSHQLNCTYLSALGDDEDRYLLARAVQLFAPGVPQVYYVGLLGGSNDHDAVVRTGEGRAVNRHDYSLAEVESALDRPLVRRQLELIRLRNTHPAFEGAVRVSRLGSTGLRIEWRRGGAVCALGADLADASIEVEVDPPCREVGA